MNLFDRLVAEAMQGQERVDSGRIKYAHSHVIRIETYV